MTMVAPALSAEEWLGEERGGLSLSTAMKEALVEFLETGGWCKDLIPSSDVILHDDVVEYFKAVFAEMGGEDNEWSGAKFQLFLVWMRRGTRTESEAKKVDEKSLGVTSAVKSIITEQCRLDMEAQGVDVLDGIAWVEMSLHLARAVTPAEMESWQYGAPAQLGQGGRMAKKFGMPTFDTAMAAARLALSLAALETHFAKCMAQWGACTGPFALKASVRLMEWWSTAKRVNDNDPVAVLDYVGEYRSLYVGRGLPTLLDAKIQAGVVSSSLHRMRAGVGGGATTTVQQGGASDKVVDKLDAKMDKNDAKMDKIMSKLDDLAHSGRATQRQVDTLRNASGGNGGDGGGGGGGDGGGPERVPTAERKCYHCGVKGHISANCPDK
jgi:hypothetical protein